LLVYLNYLAAAIIRWLYFLLLHVPVTKMLAKKIILIVVRRIFNYAFAVAAGVV